MLKTHRNGVESEEIDLFGGEMGEQAVSLSRPILDHDIEILDGANPGTHDSTSSVAENAEPPVFVRHITPHEPVTKEGTSVIFLESKFRRFSGSWATGRLAGRWLNSK